MKCTMDKIISKDIFQYSSMAFCNSVSHQNVLMAVQFNSTVTSGTNVSELFHVSIFGINL